MQLPKPGSKSQPFFASRGVPPRRPTAKGTTIPTIPSKTISTDLSLGVTLRSFHSKPGSPKIAQKTVHSAPPLSQEMRRSLVQEKLEVVAHHVTRSSPSSPLPRTPSSSTPTETHAMPLQSEPIILPHFKLPSDFPVEIFHKIFAWLPAKDMFRLMRVSRSWKSLITNQEFLGGIRNSYQLQIWKTENDPQFPHVQKSMENFRLESEQVGKRDFDELMAYRNPPQPVLAIFEAVSVARGLYQKGQSFHHFIKDGRMILHEMINFDPFSLDEKSINRIQALVIEDPRASDPHFLVRISKASVVCLHWLKMIFTCSQPECQILRQRMKMRERLLKELEFISKMIEK